MVILDLFHLLHTVQLIFHLSRLRHISVIVCYPVQFPEIHQCIYFCTFILPLKLSLKEKEAERRMTHLTHMNCFSVT